MSSNPATTFATTKLVVHDLEKMATFYCDAYGFAQTGRIQAEIGGEAIDEILLGKDGADGIPLILMKYGDRAAPSNGEVALGFTTDDINALFDRVQAAGGGVHVAPHQSEATPYLAGFLTDPEGHLIEIVELPA